MKPCTSLGFPCRKALFVKVGSGGNSAAFIHPLTFKVWAFTLATMVACGLSLCLTYVIGPRLVNTSDFEHYEPIWNGLFTAFRSFVSQSASNEPGRESSRSIFIAAFLCGVIVRIAYSTALMSQLTIKSNNLPFTSEQSLLEKSSFKILTIKGTSYEDKYKVGHIK